jgi:chemotaxis protein MotB
VEVRGYADKQLRVADNPTSPANRRISLLLPFTDVPEADAAAVTDSTAATEAVTARRDTAVSGVSSR